MKIRVVLSYVEVWNEHDQVHILHNDAGATLLNVMSYTADNLFTIPFDSLQLLLASQEASFAHDQYGTASVGSICSLKSVGVTTVSSLYPNSYPECIPFGELACLFYFIEVVCDVNVFGKMVGWP